MSIDFLLEREYDRKRYNCCHFAAEAWELLTGDARLHSIDEQDLQAGQLRMLFRQYRRVAGPTVAPSVALMQNARGDLHMGICRDRRLLHIEEGGPMHLPFDAFIHAYSNFRFYQ